LYKEGEKHVHETGGSNRGYVTILACGSTVGERLPPYSNYKETHLMGNPGWATWNMLLNTRLRMDGVCKLS